MMRSVLSFAFLFLASAKAQAYVQTTSILSRPMYVPAKETRSVQLNLGKPVRILSMKVMASAPTRNAVNTEIYVAGLNVGTIAMPGRNPDPTFSAGGSPDPTSSIDFTSYGGTVEISQINVTYEVSEVVAPVLPWAFFPAHTPISRDLERTNLTAYCGDFAVYVIDTMSAFVSPMEWQNSLFQIKWKANELKTLAKVYGAGNRDVLAAADVVITAIDEKADFLMEKSLTPVTWPHVTDLLAVREQLAAITGYKGRMPTPMKLRKDTSL